MRTVVATAVIFLRQRRFLFTRSDAKMRLQERDSLKRKFVFFKCAADGDVARGKVDFKSLKSFWFFM